LHAREDQHVDVRLCEDPGTHRIPPSRRDRSKSARSAADERVGDRPSVRSAVRRGWDNVSTAEASGGGEECFDSWRREYAVSEQEGEPRRPGALVQAATDDLEVARRQRQ
jgi:hypothetical protein